MNLSIASYNAEIIELVVGSQTSGLKKKKGTTTLVKLEKQHSY